jgi:hypothetical protein
MECQAGWTLIGSSCINVPIASLITGPLLVVLGWVVGWHSRVAFDNRRRRLDRQDARKSVQREAIELALRWIDPMSLAIMRAESVTSAYLFRRVDDNHFRDRWPKDLSAQLEALDLPVHLRPYLPEHTQQRGTGILSMFHNLYYTVLETDRSDMNQVFETLEVSFTIRRTIDQLRMDLEHAHVTTFE